jgi:uncharacterized protein (DUF58 family)
MSAMRRRWQSFWDRSPRQLKVQRDGRVILLIALASGFAAINTGNNLLFLGWGMVLAAIVISGVLSESTLRILKLKVVPPDLGRAQETVSLGLQLKNESTQSPAFATRYSVRLKHAQAESLIHGPFRLRVEAKASLDLHARFVPSARGLYDIEYVEARTAYPFGFFEKIRRFEKKQNHSFWVGPARLPVTDLTTSIYTRLGYSPAGSPGNGDEFFSLRDFRQGEDPRGIHWRASARRGKPLVREHEAMAGNKVLLQLETTGSNTDALENDLALFCSVAESLLERGMSVGILAPGVFIAPASGPRQATLFLMACASLTWGNSLPSYRLSPDTAHLVLGHRETGLESGAAFVPMDSLEAVAS